MARLGSMVRTAERSAVMVANCGSEERTAMAAPPEGEIPRVH